MPATVVLVHGAWHGPWCWERVTALLAPRGVPFVSVDLPTCDETSTLPATLHDDATAVRDALARIDGPVVLCGHSYGGMVITEAAAGVSSVRRLVYVAAFMPDEGEAILALSASERPNAPVLSTLRPRPDGRTGLDPIAAVPVFYNDCDTETSAWAVPQLRAMWVPGSDTVSAVAWRDIRSVYVVASRDETIAPSAQRRMSQRASRVLEWDTGHSPFLSQPELVAGLLEQLASADT